jgi:hypothetical protein
MVKLYSLSASETLSQRKKEIALIVNRRNFLRRVALIGGSLILGGIEKIVGANAVF